MFVPSMHDTCFSVVLVSVKQLNTCNYFMVIITKNEKPEIKRKCQNIKHSAVILVPIMNSYLWDISLNYSKVNIL